MKLVLFLLFASVISGSNAATQPNIVFILVDDFGYNDVSFHGSDQIPTPNIDALAYNGVILNQHYVLPSCSPSRSALMTGLYPIHNGMQGLPMLPSEPRGLPKCKILPEYLKELGYRTVAVGKWHLGYHREDFLPTSRGFESFLGYYNGFISYYDYIIQDPFPNPDLPNREVTGFDMRRNTTLAHDLVGQYATTMFTDEAVKTIRYHNTDQPLFLYMSHLAVHSGIRAKLLEAPPEDLLNFRHIADPNRRTYASMVAELDKSVGRIVSALEGKGLLENSIIVFTADNGAPTIGRFPNWGSNFPFKGVKETMWEGGVRGASFIYSPLINVAPRVSTQLMHMSDWLPTLYAAAGGNPEKLAAMDGMNQWRSLVLDAPSPRTEILLNIDEAQQIAGLRVNTAKFNWKLILGSINNGTYDQYFGQGTNKAPEKNPKYDPFAVTQTPAYRSIERMSRRAGLRAPTSPKQMLQLRMQATQKCPNGPKRDCDPRPPPDGPGNICLYDLKTDPCEENNLTPRYPNVARYMFTQLVNYRKSLVPQINRKREPELADPAFFNGTWSPWYDLSGVPFANGNTIPGAGADIVFANSDSGFLR